MSTRTTGLAHSVHVRLVAHAREIGIESQLILERFALDRFLYRLSKSSYAECFILKGALLMPIWVGESVRPTRDADLLGFGNLSDDALTQIFREICTLAVDPDGMEYLPETVNVSLIREVDAYGGRRVVVQSRLGTARLRVQIDVGIGDAVTPDPVWIELPTLLEFPATRLRAYRPETSIAEKLETMVVLGTRNSRMKDFYDIYVLSERKSFEGRILLKAVHDTFERRGTLLPDELPVALTSEFVKDVGKEAQWQGFIKKKSGGTSVPDKLDEVVERLADFLGPVLAAVHEREEFSSQWPSGGLWRVEMKR